MELTYKESKELVKLQSRIGKSATVSLTDQKRLKDLNNKLTHNTCPSYKCQYDGTDDEERCPKCNRKLIKRSFTKEKKYGEKTVENALKSCVEQKGGMIFKMHPITNAGIPDRIVHLNGRTFYVELKTTGERCTPIQIEMHKRLKKRNIEVYVLDVRIKDFWDLFNVCYTEYEGKHYKKNPHVHHPKTERKTYESNRNVS